MMNTMPAMDRHLHNLSQFDFTHQARFHSSLMYNRAPPPGSLIMPTPLQFSPNPHQQAHTHHHNIHHPQQHHHHHHHQQAQQQQDQHAVLMNSSPKQQQHLMPTPTSELGNQFDEQPQNMEGFPTAAEFENLLNEYILSLSPKKRDKALIPQKRYENIRAVLRDPKCTTIESAQFRFWAKKMFRLVQQEDGYNDVVCHEGKPVAVREDLYHVLTTSHGQAQHGGRDKTSAQVRKNYSWVPKELIARFVRNCPSCTLRRSSPLEFSAASNANRMSQQTMESCAPYLTSPASSTGSPPQRHVMNSPSNSSTSSMSQFQQVVSSAASSPLNAPSSQDSYGYSFPSVVNMPLDPRMYTTPSPNDLTN
ncbi:uncharacterized protein H6S33_011290 [Morchella sextelata]|jgi:hypothetical protein|uniref:uncharacterized protein n=1 Tax=Morchella sextelata TaxID=1174677 RepID=UPI001D042E57|nr:uncharacterized protein H6S33_011290 [Morchella sextelata]KAH0610863.1 hypothetical protein H6S33_011290 [Morchella sextelata]